MTQGNAPVVLTRRGVLLRLWLIADAGAAASLLQACGQPTPAAPTPGAAATQPPQQAPVQPTAAVAQATPATAPASAPLAPITRAAST